MEIEPTEKSLLLEIEFLKQENQRLKQENDFLINEKLEFKDIIKDSFFDNYEKLELLFSQSLIGIFFMMLDQPIEWNENIDKQKTIDYVFAHQRITKINNAMLLQYFANEKDFLGLTPNDIFKDNLEYWKNIWINFFDAGRIHLDTEEKKFDNSDMSIEGDYICLYDKQGRITGHFGIQQEVTQKKLIEESFRNLYENAPVPYQALDINGNIISINKKWCETTGYSKEEVLNKPFTNILTATSKEKVKINFPILIKTGKIENILLEIVSKDNKIILGQYNACTTKNKNNEFLHTNCVFENITEKQNNENILKQSENILKDAQRLAKIGHWELDIVNNKLKWSDEIYRIFGLEPQEFDANYDTFLSFIHPEDLAYVKKSYENHINNKSFYDIIHRIKLRNGRIKYVNERCKTEYDTYDKPIKSIGTVADITERINFEKQIFAEKERAEDNENQITALLNAIPDLIFILDFELRFIKYHAPKNVELYSNPDLFLGRKVLEIMPSKFIKDFTIIFDNAIKTREIQLLEYNLDGKKGIEYFEARVFAYDVDRILIIARDITERKKSEITITKQTKELQQLNIDKDRFISILAHDLKNPLSGFLGILNILNSNFKDLASDKIEKMLNMLFLTAEQTLNLLDDLLCWAKAQNGNIPFKPIEINLYNVGNEVLKNIINSSNTKNISISNLIPSEIKIFADINMLKTILRNLISNAIKFTNKDGKIEINSNFDNDFVIIWVKDSGIGIDEVNKTNLFNISKLKSTIGTAEEKGNGLGLLLCKEYIEKHGGKIWVESELGKGTTFYFSIKNYV